MYIHHFASVAVCGFNFQQLIFFLSSIEITLFRNKFGKHAAWVVVHGLLDFRLIRKFNIVSLIFFETACMMELFFSRNVPLKSSFLSIKYPRWLPYREKVFHMGS